MKKPLAGAAVLTLLGAIAHFAGCSSDSGGTGTGGGRPDQTGAACKVASECYPNVDGGALEGEVLCLTDVRGGYCTHLCGGDADCCAVPGECKSSIKEVCSPFQSTGQNMCFLSCEPGDLVPAAGQTGPVDEQEYCQRAAGRDFICRSSGGGTNNRKVCVPGDCGVGAACVGAADCTTGLDCVATLAGGYCGHEGCAANADCPTGSLCVKHSDGQSYCFRSCQGETDCTFCRGYDDPVSCTGSVNFAETGTTGTVCVPH